MSFLAICWSQILLLIFLVSSWYQKAKFVPRMSSWNKKMTNYHIKGLYKTTCYKAKSSFSLFFFSHWLLHECFFFFLIKVFSNSEKLISFHRQAFIVYKNGKKFKVLIEIFCQKIIVSNVILAFLDRFKPKPNFLRRPTMVVDIERPSPSQNRRIHPFALAFSVVK